MEKKIGMQNEANELGFSDSEQMYDYSEEDEPSEAHTLSVAASENTINQYEPTDTLWNVSKRIKQENVPVKRKESIEVVKQRALGNQSKTDDGACCFIF